MSWQKSYPMSCPISCTILRLMSRQMLGQVVLNGDKSWQMKRVWQAFSFRYFYLKWMSSTIQSYNNFKMVVVYSYTLNSKKNGKGEQHDQVIVSKQKIESGSKDLSINLFYHCNVCGEFFKAKTQIQEHFKIHTERKTNACYFCSKSFWTVKRFNNHIEFHKRRETQKSKEKLQCGNCDFFTYKSISFEKHILELNCFRFKCNLCSYKSSFQTSNNEHKKVVHGHIVKNV